MNSHFGLASPIGKEFMFHKSEAVRNDQFHERSFERMLNQCYRYVGCKLRPILGICQGNKAEVPIWCLILNKCLYLSGKGWVSI